MMAAVFEETWLPPSAYPKPFWVRTGDNQYGIPLFNETFEIQGNIFVFRISKDDSDKSVEEFMRSNIWVETYSNDGSRTDQKTLRINFKSKYENPN